MKLRIGEDGEQLVRTQRASIILRSVNGGNNDDQWENSVVVSVNDGSLTAYMSH